MLEQLKLNKSPQEWSFVHSTMKEACWDDFTLERQGDLTEWLTKHHRAEYRDNWNKIAAAYRPVVKEFVSSLSVQQNINEDLASYLQWDFLHLFIEEHFQKLPGAPLFYLKFVLPQYLENRIPCAWSGQYPEGILICG